MVSVEKKMIHNTQPNYSFLSVRKVVHISWRHVCSPLFQKFQTMLLQSPLEIYTSRAFNWHWHWLRTWKYLTSRMDPLQSTISCLDNRNWKTAIWCNTRKKAHEWSWRYLYSPLKNSFGAANWCPQKDTCTEILILPHLYAITTNACTKLWLSWWDKLNCSRRVKGVSC